MPIKTVDLHKLPDSEVLCMRCDLPLKMAGDLALAESPPAAVGSALGALASWVTFEVFICARCGKAEFFL